MKNYTCGMLGFKGAKMILKPYSPRKNCRYNTVIIDEPLENVKNYITYNLVEYLKAQKNGRHTGFIAGVAYLLDGSALMVYSSSNDNQSKLLSVHLTKKECVGSDDVVEYIAEYINSKQLEGILLIQEIEAISKGAYHFRIIHDKEEDKDDNIILFPLK